MSRIQTAATIPFRRAQLILEKRSIPVPKNGEILIRNHAIAINPFDWMIQDYGIVINNFPNVLGSDVAGVVIEVGTGVHFDVRKDDRVVGFARVATSDNADEGAFQQYTILKEDAISKIPENISFEQACVIPMGLTTVSSAIFNVLKVPLPKQAVLPEGLYKGQGFLVYGASSSVGSFAVQLASLLGFTVFAVANNRHEEYIKSLGGSYFFDRASYPDVNDLVYAVSNKARVPIRLGIDAISFGDTFERAAKILSQSGQKASLATTQPKPDQVEIPRNVDVEAIFAPSAFTPTNAIGIWLFHGFIEQNLLTGKLKPSPHIHAITGGLSAIQDALNTSKAGVSGKKIVVTL